MKFVTWLLAGTGALLFGLPLAALLWRVVDYHAWETAPDTGVGQAILLSLWTTALALIFTLSLGTPLAYGLARWQFTGKRVVNALVEMPVVMPPAVAGLALLMTFGRRGLLGVWLDDIGIAIAFTTVAVIMAQVFVGMPFYTRAAQVGFAGIDRELEDSARVDGAENWQVFVYITLPLASRALLSGALLSWARSLGEFGATIVFAGSLAGETRTMPLLVYYVLERDINAALWTGLILVGIALLAVIATRFLAREDRFSN